MIIAPFALSAARREIPLGRKMIRVVNHQFRLKEQPRATKF